VLGGATKRDQAKASQSEQRQVHVSDQGLRNKFHFRVLISDFFFSSAIDQYMGIDFEYEMKCSECEDEEVAKGKEHFLQYSCFIDKEVKYLHSGLKNVRTQNMSIINQNSPEHDG